MEVWYFCCHQYSRVNTMEKKEIGFTDKLDEQWESMVKERYVSRLGASKSY